VSFVLIYEKYVKNSKCLLKKRGSGIIISERRNENE